MNNITYIFNQKRPFYCFPIGILGFKNVNELAIRKSDFAKASSDKGRKCHFQRLGLIFYCYLFLPVGRQGYLSRSSYKLNENQQVKK